MSKVPRAATLPSDVVYLTPLQYQRRFHISKSTFWRWVREGRVTCRRLGPKTVRIQVAGSDPLHRVETSGA